MKYRALFTTALVGASGFAVYPLFAQEGGFTASVDFSQRLETGSNLGLEVPDEGDTTLATTSVDLNINSQTRTETFAFSIGGKFRAGDTPDASGIDTGFVEPSASLSFNKMGANSEFDVDASFRQSDVAFQPPFTDFINDDGQLELPEDFDDLTGSGLRNRYTFDTSLEVGKDAPVGALFAVGYSALEYRNTTAANLNNNERSNFDTTVFLRPNQSTTARVELSYDLFDDEDTVNTERETWSTVFGIENEIADSTTVDFSLGFEEVNTQTTAGTSTNSGLIGGAGFNRELPDGSVFGDFKLSRNQDGQRYTVTAGRSLELPRGSFSGSLGATSLEGDELDWVATAQLTQDLANGFYSFSLNRQVSTDDDDNERISTSVDFGYNRDINNFSSLGFDAKFGLTERNSSNSDVARSSYTVSYNRELTRDWSFSTGVTYAMRDQSGTGTANSVSVFLTLDRTFELISK